MRDLIIRNGTIVDGTGAAPFVGDIAIDGDRIVAVGEVAGPARREIDARGMIVTPGWVDIHTHYDGQATWDPLLAPSSWHGVTTAVMGNCGVGFAPAHADKHGWLIALLEGVEDIPGPAPAEGLTWDWESFPEYLNALAGLAPPHMGFSGSRPLWFLELWPRLLFLWAAGSRSTVGWGRSSAIQAEPVREMRGSCPHNLTYGRRA